METLAVVAFGVLFLAASIVKSAINTLPLAELKRRAKSAAADNSVNIYKLASHKKAADTFLLLTSGLFAAFLVLAAASAGTFIGLAAVLAILFAWEVTLQPLAVDGKLWQIANTISSLFTAVVSRLSPLLMRMPAMHRRPRLSMFDKADLLQLLGWHASHPQSRLNDSHLQAASKALTLADKSLIDFIVPLSQLKILSTDETLGPHLLDQLHKTGQRYFLVAKQTKSASLEPLGVLDLDLAAISPLAQKVSDAMSKHVYYLHEDQNIKNAIGVAIKKPAPAYYVVNSFGEIVGLIEARLLLASALGDEEEQTEVDHSNLLSVAGLGLAQSEQGTSTEAGS